MLCGKLMQRKVLRNPVHVTGESVKRERGVGRKGKIKTLLVYLLCVCMCVCLCVCVRVHH